MDCHAYTTEQYTDVTDERLSRQFDLLLSRSLSSLMHLRIVNTPLTQVPRSVCRLTKLKWLYLDNNRLTRLPDNCLNNLSNLVRFSAHDNAIGMLQDEVFDGLSKLQYLNLERNRISSIGLSVFRTSSDLASLFTIGLSENNLTSLEPWVYDRGIIGSFKRRVRIYIKYNKISKFTNEMQNSARLCANKIPYVAVFLQNNKIKYIMDIAYGWNVSFTQALDCFKLTDRVLNFLVMIDHNDIACDCVNYLFYKMIRLRGLPTDILRIIRCNLTDPLTGNSNIVNGFETDLDQFVCELTERCPARCICVRRPENATVHIYCSSSNLTVLPLELPELPDSRTKYKLDFSNNQLLHHLEYRSYFVRTSLLDVSNCGIDDIRDLEKIATETDVNLFGNKITSLPQKFHSKNHTEPSRNMNLANNLWDCSCSNKWMSKWFSSISDRLTEKVLCYSPPRLRGKNIIQISDREFCFDPANVAASKATKTALTISLSTVAGVAVVLSAVGVVVYRLRVKLYTRWKFHPFDRDECHGEDMDYDVFISCSSSDNLPHGNEIRQQLEQHGYRVCYPPRDFMAGDTIYDNIYNAVVRSKRTVCLLTENFHKRFVPFCRVFLKSRPLILPLYLRSVIVLILLKRLN